jgi:UDP-2-acetamido-3-amino-2,3-dideoxy-glucuronate N-acetyltransferase
MKQKIAVVGCGYWGRNLVRNFNELGALHTICDSDGKVLRQVALKYPQANTESQYHRVLLNREIDGVVIASPAAAHYDMAREALLAGKDVFVEKPLALRVEEGREIAGLAEEKGRILLVGLLLLYHPAVVTLKKLIDEGELGKIQYIYSNRLNLGKFRTEENIMWSFAPHDISVILLLMGDEMPQKISAHGGYYLHQDIADVTMTTMEFRDGVRAHIFVSWLHPYKEQKLVVVGNRKMALFDDTNPREKLFLYAHEIEWVERKPVPLPKEAEAVEVSLEEPLRIECQDFLACMEKRRQPVVDGHRGLRVLEVLSRCQESLEGSGKISYLDQKDGEAFVHETSVVEQPCQLGDGTKIWHFSHLMPWVTIGRNCTIGQNVFIGQGVKIGNNVKMENNVSVFEGVTLEDDVFCGPSCVFTNVTNPRSHVPRKHELKSTLVRKGATIGANATIVCGHTVGRYAFIGAGAVVTKDIPDHALVYGDPARLHGWVCQCGVKLQGKSGRVQCPECGKVYELARQTCSPLAGGEENENPAG